MGKQIYGVPLTGSVFIEAESPAAAFDITRTWSETVLGASVNGDSVALPAGIDLLIIKPQDKNIKDATDLMLQMLAEAEE